MTTLTYSPPAEFRDKAHISTMETYHELYQESIKNPSAFWSNIAAKFYWKQLPDRPSLEYNFDPRKAAVSIKFLDGAVTNVCYNVLDKHVESGLGMRTAYICEGNEPGQTRTVTYAQLRRDVCRLANGLKQLGMKKGDRAALYMPSSVELVRRSSLFFVLFVCFVVLLTSSEPQNPHR